MIVFVIQAVFVLLAPLAILLVRFLILGLNILISAVLGWRLYKQWFHMTLTYDNDGFTLRKGASEVTHRNWKDFSQVSLIRTEYGDFSVRLYQNAEFFDLPVSKLKLDPFQFRFEIIKLVSAVQK